MALKPVCDLSKPIAVIKHTDSFMKISIKSSLSSHPTLNKMLTNDDDVVANASQFERNDSHDKHRSVSGGKIPLT